MAPNETLRFYNEQARQYPVIRARPIQVYTDDLERKALAPYVASAKAILDLGCGEGRLTRWMAEQVQACGGTTQVHGADFSPEMIAVAQALNGDLPATYGVGDAMALPYADSSFDLVVSSTAPNNFPNLDTALGEIHRVLSPGGYIFAVVINKSEAARFARYAYYAPYFAWRLLRRAWKGPSTYERTLYTRSDLESLLRGRFEIIRMEGLRVVSDFIPEFPLNFWPPLFPVMRGLIRLTTTLDQRLAEHPVIGRHARFHLVIARVIK